MAEKNVTRARLAAAASAMARGAAPLARVCARGAALFVGAFSLANSIVRLAGGGRSEDLWWIDLSGLPGFLGGVLTGVSAVLLLLYALRGAESRPRRLATAGVCALLAAIALSNVAAYVRVVASGAIVPGAPLPFSAVVAAVLGGVAAVLVWLEPPAEPMRRHGLLGVGAVALGCAVAFPLAHVYFFGTTDYRAPADVAVVLGAKVYDDGALSWSLEDRVATGAELYRDGLVGALVMSGGTGANGVDETAAMARRATELGVDASDIARDPDGINTDATVRNTTELFGQRGWQRVLVVSQFYHLPRIKMAYRAAGYDVRTVPAAETRVIPKTPLFVAREIGGFWVYWGRSALREVASGE